MKKSLDEYQKLIKQFQQNIWTPKYQGANIYEVFKYERTKAQLPRDKKTDKYQCYRINLNLDETQTSKVLETMKRTTTMYNITVKFLWKLRKNSNEVYKKILNFEKVRSRLLKEKAELVEKYKTNVNILDAAIKHAVTAFKSAETNMKNGYISHFKVRCLKQNRNNRIIEIDKDRFRCKSVIKSIFEKEIDCYLEGKLPFHTALIDSSCFIRYSKQKHRFQLIVNQNMDKDLTEANFSKQTRKIAKDFTFGVPTQKQYKDAMSRYVLTSENKLVLKNQPIPEPVYKFSSLDPGLSTFMTCLTDQDTHFFGTTEYTEVKKLLGNIQAVYQKQTDVRKDGSVKVITDKMKNKYTRRIERRIKGIIDNLHWQTINTLTNKSEEVIIGNMSSKGIVRNNTFDYTSKQAILRMRFYQFRQRLKQKCLLKDRRYICVYEGLTSKVCSVCGNYNKDLQLSDRVYNCSNCKVSIQRDLNSCRGIWIKSMDKTNFRNA